MCNKNPLFEQFKPARLVWRKKSYAEFVEEENDATKNLIDQQHTPEAKKTREKQIQQLKQEMLRMAINKAAKERAIADTKKALENLNPKRAEAATGDSMANAESLPKAAPERKEEDKDAKRDREIRALLADYPEALTAYLDARYQKERQSKADLPPENTA